MLASFSTFGPEQGQHLPMSDSSVLGQVALGYSPMIDRHKAITALRLTVFPVRPDAVPDAHALLAALAAA